MARHRNVLSQAFQVARHVRGKWVCRGCERLIQAPVPAQVIDKGIPTAGLLAQVLVSKHADHQPLYRQEGIFERAGVALPRSTLAQWVGACGLQLAPLAEAIKAVLLSRTVLHADETTGRAAGALSYVHVACTEYLTLMHVGGRTVADIDAGGVLAEFTGVLVRDGYAGYEHVQAMHAWCGPHYADLRVMPRWELWCRARSAPPSERPALCSQRRIVRRSIRRGDCILSVMRVQGAGM